jgi:hypothetical protein
LNLIGYFIFAVYLFSKMFKIALLGVNALLLLQPTLEAQFAVEELKRLVAARQSELVHDMSHWLETTANKAKIVSNFKSSQSKIFSRIVQFPYLAYIPASKFIKTAASGYGQVRSSVGGCANLHVQGAIFEANVLGYDIK